MAEPHGEAGPPRHRRWPRRLLIAANIIVAICVVGTAGGYAYIRITFGDIPRLFVDGLEPPPAPKEPMNVLLVGSDTRATIDPNEQKSFGSTKDVGGQRSDTIIVLRIEPNKQRAAMLSIPRDLYVKIAGTNRSDRINNAFQGGASQLVATVNETFGIAINHYVQVDFKGFRGIVNAVGGVEIYSAARARDKVSGLNIPNPGCVELNGDQALAFVRSRNYEFFENGRWRTDPTGDLGRIQRQQDFVRRVLKEAGQEAKSLDFRAISDLVGAAKQNVEIDKSFKDKDLLGLANRFRSLDPAAVEMLTIPTTPANIGGAAVLRLKQPDAKAVVDTFLARNKPAAAPPAGQVPNIPLSSIKVRVLNGSGAEGQARQVSNDMTEVGFAVTGIGEADSFRYNATVLKFPPGGRDKALVAQSKIQGATELREDPTIRGGIDVIVITGGAFGGIVGAAPPPTTTAKPAPPTTAAKGKAATTTTAKPGPPQPTC